MESTLPDQLSTPSGTRHHEPGGRVAIQDRPPTSSAALRIARKVAIAVLGGTLLLIGLALLVLPGPAFVVIPAGLAILSIEFRWARGWIRRARAALPKPRSDTTPAHAEHHAPVAIPRPNTLNSNVRLVETSEEDRSPYSEDEPLR